MNLPLPGLYVTEGSTSVMNIRSSVLAVALGATLSIALAAPTHPKKHKITPTQATKIATAKYPGSVLKKPKLEFEDGVWQWEIIVKSHGKMTEVNVNADTGKIGSVENTSPGEEAKEAKADKKGKGGH